MNWDAFAGGVAKGYNAAEELRMKREAADRLKREDKKKQAYEEDHKNDPMPGDIVDPAAAALPPAPTQQQHAGLLGALTRNIRPKQAAAAAEIPGAFPPAPAAPAPAAPAAPAPAPTAAPAGAGIPTPDLGNEVAEVTVRGAPAHRYDDLDAARRDYAIARKNGMTDQQMAARDKIMGLEQKHASYDVMSTAQKGWDALTAKASDVMNDEITATPIASGAQAGMFHVTGDNGTDYGVFKDPVEMARSVIIPHITKDPTAAFEVAHAYETERRTIRDMETDKRLKAFAADTQRIVAQSNDVQSRAAAAKDLEGVAASQAARQEIDGFSKALTDSDPVLNSSSLEAQAAALAAKHPEYWEIRANPNDPNGQPIKVNKALEALRGAQEAWGKNLPKGVSVGTIDGKSYYRVDGINGAFTTREAASYAAKNPNKFKQPTKK